MQVRSRRAFREARIGPLNHQHILSNPQEQVQKLHKHQKHHPVSMFHTVNMEWSRQHLSWIRCNEQRPARDLTN